MKYTFLLLIVAQLVIGTSGIFTRMALQGTGPVTATFLRVLIASLVTFSAALYFKKLIVFDKKTIFRLLLAGISLSIHFVAWMEALNFISVSVATLLVATTPFFLVFYETVAERQSFRPLMLVALPLAALCILTITLNEHGGKAPLHGHTPIGVCCGLASAAGMGCYLVLLKPMQKIYPTFSLITYTYPSSALFLAPFSIAFKESVPSNLISWIGIFSLALFTQLLGHTALAASLRFFRPSVVAFAGLLTPVVASISAALFLAEPLIPIIDIAGIILLAAVALILVDAQAVNAVDNISASEA